MRLAVEDLEVVNRIAPNGTRARILAELQRAYPDPVDARTLCQAIYPTDEDGLSFYNLRRRIVSLRKALGPTGWTVSRTKGDRSKLGTYRLAKQETIR